MQRGEAAATKESSTKTVSKSNAAHFFMSANTPSGYISKFAELYDAKSDWKAYILKSVPGTVPILLPDMGEELEKNGFSVEYIHCVLDPELIAAIVLPNEKIAVIDSMPPHCIEASFPGVVEEEIMLAAPDNSKLSTQKKQILQFTARSSALYDRVYRYLSAASSLQNDIFKIAFESVDNAGITKYVTGLSKRLFTQKEGTGKVYPRYLTGITYDGIVSFYKKNSESYDKIYAVEDEFGIGSILLTELEKRATKAGYDVYSCVCPILGELQAIFIPELTLAFVTSNSHHRAEGKAVRHINIKRFTDYDTLRLKKARIGFNRRAARELYEKAVELLSEAKTNDDIVRDCYRSAVDIDKARETIGALTDKIIELNHK